MVKDKVFRRYGYMTKMNLMMKIIELRTLSTARPFFLLIIIFACSCLNRVIVIFCK